MWWDHDIGWGSWLMMTIAMAGFWSLLAITVVTLVRRGRPDAPETLDAREVLDRRLALGEIDLEEYRRRLDALGGADR